MTNHLQPSAIIVAGIGLRIQTIDEVNDQCHVKIEAWFELDDEVMTALQRLRGIYFTCISEINHVVIKQNFLKDRILFNEDVRKVVIDDIEYLSLAVKLELTQELGIKLNSGWHYLQASAFTCTSNIIKLQVV